MRKIVSKALNNMVQVGSKSPRKPIGSGNLPNKSTPLQEDSSRSKGDTADERPPSSTNDNTRLPDFEEKHRRYEAENRILLDQRRALEERVQGDAIEIERLLAEIRNANHDRQRIEKEHKRMTETMTHDRHRIEQEYKRMMETMNHDRQMADREARRQAQKVAEEHRSIVESLNYKIRRIHEDAEQKSRLAAEEYSRRIDEFRALNAKKLSELHQEHQRIQQKLQYQAEELNEAWLNRDDQVYQSEVFTTSGLPDMPDNKIGDQVRELQRIVDALSRAEWKPDQDLWTNSLLEKVGQHHGQRAVKKAMVQDLIWTQLFLKVFCSPFRLFGEAGKKIEGEWNDACGKGVASDGELYAWPTPSIKTERFRYMGMKDCHEALTVAISSVDKRAGVKRGFKNSHDELVAALNNELRRMLNLASQEAQLVEMLAKRAAAIWLDFAMHRCRIVVRLSGSAATSAEKAAAVQRGPLTLTVRPIVGRYGNAKGMELDRFTTIKGCEGDTLSIP